MTKALQSYSKLPNILSQMRNYVAPIIENILGEANQVDPHVLASCFDLLTVILGDDPNLPESV